MTTEPPTATGGGRRPKTVLICPTCGHESPPAGDWRSRRLDSHGTTRLALVCPACDTTITYRPLADTGSTEQLPLPCR